MGVPFDHIATTYDDLFTRSMIGQLQRKRVWSYLEKITPELKGLDILELNCGTGEDAILFSEKGFNIIATDISEEMLSITQEKVQQFSLQNKISSHYLDLESFDDTLFNKKFDLVFSNFGGLNCIPPETLKHLIDRIPSVLAPGGRFIGVVMGKHCTWETFYFLLKLKFNKAFRRWTSKSIDADLNGVFVKTWYYSPSQIKRWAKRKFKIKNILPVGLSIPPSYLENFFSQRKRTLLRLNGIEKRLGNVSLLSAFSDHYIIDLSVK